MKKRILFLTIAVIAVIILILGAKSITTSAMQDKDRPKTCYESILIRENDSLWGIAEAFAPKFGMSTSDYVEELKRVNGLKEDKILAGGRIIVLYDEGR